MLALFAQGMKKRSEGVHCLTLDVVVAYIRHWGVLSNGLPWCKTAAKASDDTMCTSDVVQCVLGALCLGNNSLDIFQHMHQKNDVICPM